MGRVLRILAPNPGPFTLEGTNTWVIGEDPAVVIDPGPDDRDHLEAVANAAGPIRAIVLTHHHLDHAQGAARLAGRTGRPPVLAANPDRGEHGLASGDVIDAGGLRLRAVATPGHAPDHLAVFAEDGSLFTGDAVLGRGTSVIDPPEGDMAAYLRSLDAMIALHPQRLYPGHGPVVEEAGRLLEEYRDHRRLREQQVIEVVRRSASPRSPDQIVPDVYLGYPAELFPAAARTVLAHLLKLEQDGIVRGTHGGFVLAERSRSSTT